VFYDLARELRQESIGPIVSILLTGARLAIWEVRMSSTLGGGHLGPDSRV
jgi:hypothetical protein